MKTKPAYLIIDTGSPPRIVRVTQRWPSLDAGEIIVRVSLEISDELLPQIQAIEIEDRDALGVAVETFPLVPPEREES